jgi:hypothetical protein
MYSLELDSGGNFILVDAGPGAGLTPATTDVSVKDDIQDGDTDRHSVIGENPNDQFHVSRADGLNGLYTFVSVGLTSDAFGSGMIAMNEETGQYFFFTNATLDSSQEGAPLSLEEGPLQVCFMPGTMIATPAGEKAVEDLKIGDLVTTTSGKATAVLWIGRQSVAPAFADELRLPVRVRAGAIAEAVPSRDLLLSPDHALMIDGALIHAGALVNGTSIVRERNVPMLFTYFHIETEDHALILAENTPAETFIDNVGRMLFDNWGEYSSLYPEERTIAEMPWPRAKAYRQVPPALRQALAERAVDLYGQVAEAA